MAVLKYDVSDVETGGGGEEPQPALYKGKVVGLTHRTKLKNDTTNKKISDVEMVVDIGAQYVRLWNYIKLPDDPEWDKERHGWKFREMTDALGLPPKGGIDLAKLKQYEGTEINVRVAADSNRDGSYRGKIKNIFLPSASDDAVANADGDAAAGDGAEGPFGREEMDTWTDDDLKEYANELGVDIPSGRGARGKLLDALVVAESEEADGEQEPAEAETTGDTLDDVPDDVKAELRDDPAYYGDWSDDDVKWMVVGLGIDGNVATSGRGWKSKAVNAIVEIASQYTNGGSAAAAEPDTYDEEGTWPTPDLKAEIESRNEQGAGIEISGRWTRQKMIDVLREDDKAAQPF